VTIYSPAQTGVNRLSSPDAGNRLCCLFEDSVVDNSANPLCFPVTSYLSVLYAFNGSDYFDFQLDNVVLSLADEARFIMAYETPVTGTATGTARTAHLGDQAFTVTPYSVLNILGLAFEAVGSTATSISLAVGAQGPLPLTTEQRSLWGNLFVRVIRMDNASSIAEFTVFRRDGLDNYSIPTSAPLSASELFETYLLVNTDPPATYTADLADSAFLPTFAYRPPPTDVNSTSASPQGFGFVQYVMTSAAVTVSAMDTVAFRIAFENTTDAGFTNETWEFRINPISYALSSTLSFSYNLVLPSVTQEVTVQDREISSFVVDGGYSGARYFQILMAIYNGDWVVQLMPCLDGFCDAAIFDSFP